MTTTIKTVQGLAQSLYNTFETKTRTNGEEFVSSPDAQAIEIVHAVHDALPGQPLPDDWIYKATKAALGFIAELPEDKPYEDEYEGDFREQYTDDYYFNLRQWFANCSIAPDLVDEALENGCPVNGGIFVMLQGGQSQGLGTIFNTVYGSLMEAVETVGEGN